MAFRGWPAEALEFYEGLEADNAKAYWQDHRDVYETYVRAPMEALLEKVEPEFGKGKIFRPYRDVRFSADKSPYKTAIGAVASQHGSVFYVQLSADGLFAASGYYQMARDQLNRFRAAVDDDGTGEELVAIVAGLESEGYDVGGEALRSAPRGFRSDHPRIKLLRHTGVTMGRSWAPAAWLGTARAADRVTQVWRAARPLNEWLQSHVGPSTEAASSS
ncbi:MAG: DUF2461 domain-containing protein [Actinomycetota bacterium]|nr:DUF2461 domain-containing protein [Actinomycetota bacterium]